MTLELIKQRLDKRRAKTGKEGKILPYLEDAVVRHIDKYNASVKDVAKELDLSSNIIYVWMRRKKQREFENRQQRNEVLEKEGSIEPVITLIESKETSIVDPIDRTIALLREYGAEKRELINLMKKNNLSDSAIAEVGTGHKKLDEDLDTMCRAREIAKKILSIEEV